MSKFVMFILFMLWVPNTLANEIYLIPTLHKLHGEVTNFSFDDLKQVLDKIKPDVLLVELTNNDIDAEKEQRYKVEYNQVVLPYAKSHDVPMVALEPDEPLWSELVNLMRENNQRVAEQDSVEVAVFGEFLDTFYARFSNDFIQSGADLSSPVFDALCELKHEFQIVIYGQTEQKVWDGWNNHFLEVILKTNATHKDIKIAVLVGAEHHYWLKDALLKKQISLSPVPF